MKTPLQFLKRQRELTGQLTGQLTDAAKAPITLITTSISVHTRRVGRTKKALLVVAVILAATLVAWPLIKGDKKRLNLSFSSIEGPLDTPTMNKPRFHGVDRDNQPYNISADKAVQQTKNEVELEKVNGDITLKGGIWVDLTAAKGHIFVEEKKLHLTEKVNLYSSHGYELETQEAIVFLEQKRIIGPQKVLLQGSFGTLKADNFEVLDEGKTIHFLSNVEMKIYP